MATIEELKARLAAAKAVNNKADPDLLAAAKMAQEIDAEHARADEELKERLNAEAVLALTEARAEKPDVPLRAVVSIEAHKTIRIGWLVLGPGDVSYAIQALRRAGTFDPSSRRVDGADNDIDIIASNVNSAIVRAPVKLENYAAELRKIPPFARACFVLVEQTRGSGAEAVEGKSKP